MTPKMTFEAAAVNDLLAALPAVYEKPDVSVFSAEALEQGELRLVTGISQLSEEGDYYF